jgi:curved DNA-binding protein CbpA
MDQSFRPFSTFSLQPFLWASEEDQRLFRNIFIKLSRQYHPDFMLSKSEEERAEAETHSAQINRDYAILCDPEARLEAVVNHFKVPTQAPAEAPAEAIENAPPDLAMEYFDYQEKTEDLTQNSVEFIEAKKKFSNKLEAKKNQLDKEIEDICRRHAYPSGVESHLATVPHLIAEAEVKQVSNLLSLRRYVRRMLSEIENQ